MKEFNSASNDDLSLLFFGGEYEDAELKPILNEDGSYKVFKTGKQQGEIKFKKELVKVKMKGLGLNPLKEWKTKKEGVFQTNEEVLNKIRLRPESEAAKIASLILEIRGIKKQISTYYESTLEQLDENDFVHPKFSHCSTGTGRLGCSKPNVQNQPDKAESRVKEHFVSRFSNGVLVNLDYSQIEPCTHAQLSGDPDLMADIQNKVDTYCKYLANIENMEYNDVINLAKVKNDVEWVAKRNQAKTVVLADRYGAGVTKLVQQSGLTINEVKRIKESTNELYPTYAAHKAALVKQVEQQGFYRGFTGRIYAFKKYPSKFGQARDGYSYNEVINYLYQGTATADLVLIMLGKFWRQKAIYHRDKYLLINTIHDSIMLDVNVHCADSKMRVEYIKKQLQMFKQIPLMCLDEFNYKWTVPINIDITIGHNWYNLK